MDETRSDIGSFTIMPVWVLDSGVSRSAIALFAVLASYADRDDQRCWPSRATLAKRLGASTRSVDTWLKELRTVGAVDWEQRVDPSGKGNLSNLFTVRFTNPRGPDCPTPGENNDPPPGQKEQQRTISNELKKTTPASPSPDVRRVFDAWVESTGRDPKRTRIDDKRRRLIVNALASYPVEDVCAAVTGWERSAFHSGDNDRGREYNDLGLLLRDAEKIEYFRDQAPSANGAGRAWQEVVDAAARFGRTGVPDWGEQTRQALQAIGGYYEVCNATNVAGLRKRFVDAYESASRARR